MVEITQQKIDFDFREISNGANLSKTFESSDWTHYETGDKYGLVAFLSRVDSQSPSHVRIAELVLDLNNKYSPVLINNHPVFAPMIVSYDAFWAAEKLKLYERMHSWLKENCYFNRGEFYTNLKSHV